MIFFFFYNNLEDNSGYRDTLATRSRARQFSLYHYANSIVD